MNITWFLCMRSLIDYNWFRDLTVPMHLGAWGVFTYSRALFWCQVTNLILYSLPPCHFELRTSWIQLVFNFAFRSNENELQGRYLVTGYWSLFIKEHKTSEGAGNCVIVSVKFVANVIYNDKTQFEDNSQPCIWKTDHKFFKLLA
jgi:hypothetical protein